MSESGGAVLKCSSNTKTTTKMATPVSCTKLFSLKRAVVVLGARGGGEEAEGVARQRTRLAGLVASSRFSSVRT